MIIERTQIEAKWNSEIKRREKIENYLRMYDNFQKKDLIELIELRLNKEEARELQKYKKTENITKQIIDNVSLLFQKEVQILLLDGLIVDEEQSNKLFEILESVVINAILQETNKYVNLTRDVALLPQIRDGKIEIDIITSDQMIVKQKDDDPTKAEWIAYQVGINTNTFQSNKVNIYHKWSEQGKSQIEVGDKGQILSEVFIDAPDYNGEIPIVMFRNYIPKDTFFKEFESELVEFNKMLNYNLTRLEMMRDYNLPQRVDFGTDPDKTYPVGITMRMTFDNGAVGDVKPDSKYINPNFPIEIENESNIKSKEMIAISSGLSGDSIRGGEFTSGYEMRLSKENIFNKNRTERPFYRNSIKNLIKIIMLTANNIGGKFDINLGVKVSFGEIEYSEDPFQTASTRSIKIKNGTNSRIDFIMEDNPHLTREEAEAKASVIDKDNNLILNDNINNEK